MCVLGLDGFRVCWIQLQHMFSMFILFITKDSFLIFSLYKTVVAHLLLHIWSYFLFMTDSSTTFFKYKVLMTYTHLRAYMHTCIRTYDTSLKLLRRNHEQRHTRARILNGGCLHRSKNTRSGGSGGGGSHSSAPWLLQLKQQVSASYMYNHTHLKNDSTCRWEQVFLDLRSQRWKEKKQVNKQRQKQREWGGRESGNGRRENRTNIKMTIEANRWGEREN